MNYQLFLKTLISPQYPSVCSDAGLTLETLATLSHQIPQAKKNNIYQPLLIKTVFSLPANAEKQGFFSKLLFQC